MGERSSHNRAAALAERLADTGVLADPDWLAAVGETDREVLVPRFFRRHTGGTWSELADSADPADRTTWLDAVYGDRDLPILLGRDEPRQVLSVATAPTVLARMLAHLGVRTGDRVLHVGIGSGYLTALLCHRLGSDRVAGLDIEPELRDLAADRLATLGHTPDLRYGDGREGFRAHAPFDRIVVTGAVTAIPPCWLRQLNPGGTILTDFAIGPRAGNLVRLDAIGERVVQGRFLDANAKFAQLSATDGTPDQPDYWADAADQPEHSWMSTVDPTVPEHPGHRIVWFLAAPELGAQAPYVRRFFDEGDYGWTGRVWLAAPDGSRACNDSQPAFGTRAYRVIETGPRRLWTAVERAYQLWSALGRPGWDRFGLTVTPHEHTLWLDTPDGDYRWTRPTHTALRAWTPRFRRNLPIPPASPAPSTPEYHR